MRRIRRATVGWAAYSGDYPWEDYTSIIAFDVTPPRPKNTSAYRQRPSHVTRCGRDPNAAHAFTHLVEAYGVLSDAGKRKGYDAFLDRDRALPVIQVRFHSRLRPVIDIVARRLPEDPLPFLMQALQVIGLSLAAVILLLAALYVL